MFPAERYGGENRLQERQVEHTEQEHRRDDHCPVHVFIFEDPNLEQRITLRARSKRPQQFRKGEGHEGHRGSGVIDLSVGGRP